MWRRWGCPRRPRRRSQRRSSALRHRCCRRWTWACKAWHPAWTHWSREAMLGRCRLLQPEAVAASRWRSRPQHGAAEGCRCRRSRQRRTCPPAAASPPILKAAAAGQAALMAAIGTIGAIGQADGAAGVGTAAAVGTTIEDLGSIGTRSSRLATAAGRRRLLHRHHLDVASKGEGGEGAVSRSQCPSLRHAEELREGHCVGL
mmetsp:Transcript_36988/g.106548  ORF Transcript_36988/g.106548 Transcript_36988/m.106548 type:complete len:202 (+) Transcript_36988:3-608(+)